ncbi:LLM class flavin-dependent oxidoreductase [Sphaerisporangium corydalis]|uniref:LLM class flavin-dependent oxidoreductase n=1 Tax=Sphaerisporangium corydalis TaxID=1441875 RepID=A0ABV9ENQ1_9ACTN|nr:LLM class flavin-dependent oxidoreductase [Sphaerisporangium corydalis]
MTLPHIGVFLTSGDGQPGAMPGGMTAAARHAEDLGLESVWITDQLIAGTGSPILDSGLMMAAVAASTTRIRLGFGVLVLPLRPVVWVAKQLATLQYLSGDRLLLGVGAGGDRHERSWSAAGVPRRERGRRTDTALRALPGLMAGKDTLVEDLPGAPTVRLAPAATMPPVLVGGGSEAALARAARYGDEWFPAPVGPATVAEDAARLAELAGELGRRPPAITAGVMVAMTADPASPSREALVRDLTSEEYGLTAAQAEDLLVSGDGPEVAARLADFAAVGAGRVVASFAGGDWGRQCELLAEAVR